MGKKGMDMEGNIGLIEMAWKDFLRAKGLQATPELKMAFWTGAACYMIAIKTASESPSIKVTYEVFEELNNEISTYLEEANA